MAWQNAHLRNQKQEPGAKAAVHPRSAAAVAFEAALVRGAFKLVLTRAWPVGRNGAAVCGA